MAIPATPSNFNLQTGNGNNFLSWDVDAGATTYIVQRSLDGVTFATIATITGSPLNNFYFDAVYNLISNPGGVLPATKYYYQVAAQNISGISAYTAIQSIVPTGVGQMSLAWVRNMALLRADMVNSQFISLPEANSYISGSYKALYDLMTQKFGDEYFSSSTYTWSTAGNQNMYPLPPDFYKSTLVEIALNPGDPQSWVTLRRFNKVQQNLLNFPNVYTLWGVTNLRYRLTGNFIELAPYPTGGQTLRMWYAPRPPILMQDTDIVDGVSGWEDYIILDAARKMMLKQEQDIQEVTMEVEGLVKRIESAAENRDIAEPDTVSDSRRRNFAWGDSGGGTGGGDAGWS